MKNLVTILLALWILIDIKYSHNQEFDYSKAWKEGYIDGYCYDIPYCVEPIPPVPPVQRFQDSTYQLSYNRGFVTGLKNQKE